ncbi:agmatine deiminase family protein [Luteimonas sp. FXH3W]|uniref:Agmatine deiminase family protein n=1 Tax=Aquilutibacter rugosus TaxID=3115820 RepID=A0ABU7UZK0_9GAMM
MTDKTFRFPAEWEPQDAILIAWPTEQTDWADRLGEVEETYIALVQAITRYQPVLIVAADDDIESYAQARLSSNRVDMQRVKFLQAPYDDTWLRDTGPITLRDGDRFLTLDYRFTGWGGKFGASQDDLLVQRLSEQRTFNQDRLESVDFALEGGAIETDGAGTLLSTWTCLQTRHPDRSRDEVNAILQSTLNQDRILWLDNGYLEGDDTDAHIDTLARFAGADRIVYQSCDDANDTHFEPLQAMAAELAAFRTTDGQPYQLFALPWADPILDEGRRLAASYANFLIVNGAVIMPGYGDVKDAQAVAVMQQAFPQHEIVQVNCRPLIWQNGSLHCITMQMPRGSVADKVLNS